MFTTILPTRGRRVRQSTRAALVAALLAVSIVGCELPPRESGPVPEGVRRELPYPGDGRRATTGTAPIGAPPDTPGPGGEGLLPPAAPHSAVTATTATGEYHTSSCPLLAGAGATRSFGSAFEAVDAGLAPCATCNPGP